LFLYIYTRYIERDREEKNKRSQVDHYCGILNRTSHRHDLH